MNLEKEWKFYTPSLLGLALIAFLYAFPFFAIFLLSAGVFLVSIIYAVIVTKFLKLRRDFYARGGMGEAPSEPNFRNVTVNLIKKSKDTWGTE